MIRRISSFAVLLLAAAALASGVVLAADAASAASAMTTAPTGNTDAEAMQEVLNVLQQETNIATRTKLNHDYVPGMVTVLQGDTLEAMGVRTVLDALSLVPGIQTFREATGAPNLSMRGIAYPFNAGNTKILIDGVSISREEAGVNSSALLTRIEQVERIEVIRGPSSSIHGAFAFAGVVDIITRDTGGRAFTSFNTDDGRSIGGRHSWKTAEDGWKFSLNTAGYDGNAGEGGIGTFPEASGSTSILKAQHEGFSLRAHWLTRDQSAFVAPVNAFLDGDERTYSVDTRQVFEHSPTLQSELRLTYLDNGFQALSSGKQFTGDRVEGAYDLHWAPTDGHKVLFGGSYSHSQIDNASLILPGPFGPLLRSVLVDRQRRITSLTLQDQIDLGDRLTLTAGGRFDDYDDVRSRVTPRVGLVYRAGSNHIFKAQYSEGFRPPTFWELYAPGAPDPNLDFEVIRTSEFGYVYRKRDSVGRLTVFDSHIDDMLFLVLPPPGPGPTIFRNNTRARMTGVEAEWEQTVTDRLKWLVNVSNVDTFDTRSTSRVTGDSAVAADWLGNLAVTYRPWQKATITSRLLHVSDRHTATGRTDGYDSLDLTLTLADAPSKDWTLRAGVHNLLDANVTHLVAFPNTTHIVPYDTQNVWLQLSRAF